MWGKLRLPEERGYLHLARATHPQGRTHRSGGLRTSGNIGRDFGGHGFCLSSSQRSKQAQRSKGPCPGHGQQPGLPQVSPGQWVLPVSSTVSLRDLLTVMVT